MYDYPLYTTNIDPPVDTNSDKLCESTFLIRKGEMCHILLLSTLFDVLTIKITWYNFIEDIAMSKLAIDTKPIVIAIMTDVNSQMQWFELVHLDAGIKVLMKYVLIYIFIYSSL